MKIEVINDDAHLTEEVDREIMNETSATCKKNAGEDGGAIGQNKKFETKREYADYLTNEYGNPYQQRKDDDDVALKFKEYYIENDSVRVQISGFGDKEPFSTEIKRAEFEEFIGKAEGNRGKLEVLLGLQKEKRKKVSSAEKNVEARQEFSEKELSFMLEYTKDAREMLKFIEDLDYVGQFGYKEEDVEMAIQAEKVRYWGLLKGEMLEEGYFKDEKRANQVMAKIRNTLEVGRKLARRKTQEESLPAQEGAVNPSQDPGAQVDSQPKNITEEETSERIFDINNKEQQIELIKEGKIYYAEKMGREKNLETAFAEFENANQEFLANYRDKDILLKVNLVDPDNSQSCSDSKTVKKIIELIKKYAPKKIYIGDVPSTMGKKGRNWDDLKKIYESQLGYAFGSDAELINLEELEEETIVEGGESFQVKKLDRFDGIINISRPKMHGEFGFTGCTKNLMGFMTQDSRDANIHMNKGRKYSEQVANERLSKFSEAMLKNRPDMLNITDGTDFIIGHEHIGIAKKTDFALVSRDPFNSDQEMLKLLGLNKAKASYIENETFSATSDKLIGSMERSKIYPSELEKKTMLYEMTSDGRASFVQVIADPEFLNNLKIKKRYVDVYMEILKKAFVDHLGDKFLAGMEQFSSERKTVEDFFNILFTDEKLIKNNPYNNKNFPEFGALVEDWINERKI